MLSLILIHLFIRSEKKTDCLVFQEKNNNKKNNNIHMALAIVLSLYKSRAV